ncbi:small leucine-rich protein 1 isoform X1 [Cygnus atratus]|uniref:small leucine-rich protein 1 isoform X1 n=1 Tax=Cygnus atratus TaxID=8868 RepID=UPI0021B71671|nr:small leucine-rich protein 1 isoform X1 [Cygnus atratus]
MSNRLLLSDLWEVEINHPKAVCSAVYHLSSPRTIRCDKQAKTEQNRKRRWAPDPKVDKELAMLHDPRNTLLDYRKEQQKLWRSGKKVNKCRN